MRAFVAAFQFLTRLPLSVRFIWSDTLAARSLVWFPVVGFFIGCLLVLLATGLPMLFPPIISALLFVAIWVALTGALHLDGLLDTADGLLSHRSRERMLEIMKDSRIGAMGAITCFFYLALKTAAVCFIIENPTLLNLGCLMLTPAISRWMLTLAITTRPYIRDKQGMGHMYQNSGIKHLLGATIMLGGCIAFLLFAQLNENTDQSLWMLPLIMLVAALLIGIFFFYICQKKLGGMTGDTYGALNELVELGLLFVIILWAGEY